MTLGCWLSESILLNGCNRETSSGDSIIARAMIPMFNKIWPRTPTVSRRSDAEIVSDELSM